MTWRFRLRLLRAALTGTWVLYRCRCGDRCWSQAVWSTPFECPSCEANARDQWARDYQERMRGAH